MVHTYNNVCMLYLVNHNDNIDVSGAHHTVSLLYLINKDKIDVNSTYFSYNLCMLNHVKDSRNVKGINF